MESAYVVPGDGTYVVPVVDYGVPNDVASTVQAAVTSSTGDSHGTPTDGDDDSDSDDHSDGDGAPPVFRADDQQPARTHPRTGACVWTDSNAQESYFGYVVRHMSSSPRQLVRHIESGDFASLSLALRKARFLVSGHASKSGSTTDWQGRLAAALQDSDSKSLFELTRDFNETARLYGKVIIMEQHLLPHQKSIAAAKLGGVAGGEKFIGENGQLCTCVSSSCACAVQSD